MTKRIEQKIIAGVKNRKPIVSVDELNEIFTPLSYRERITQLYEYFEATDVLYTSSFGTKSAFLLYLISQLQPTQPVHFINTTYHFKETIDYKNHLARLFDLDVINVMPAEVQNRLTFDEQWWKEHPKMCCSINKVVPLEPIIAEHKVWISGLMSYQTQFRSRLRVFEQQGDIIKFHPIVDIDEGEFLYQFGFNKLPEHPLKTLGYGSIGCVHCTEKGSGREGRWSGTNKTECGLHPNYFINKKK
ncbi:MAG: phosphoadenylyl-sulfate reductase [Bacteroidota bacterium]